MAVIDPLTDEERLDWRGTWSREGSTRMIERCLATIATAREESYRAGLEAAARVCEIVDPGAPAMWKAAQVRCAKAVRALLAVPDQAAFGSGGKSTRDT